MALLDRIIAPLEAEDKIPIHGFCGSLMEWAWGAVTRAQVINAWTITAGEEADLDWLQGQYAATPAAQKDRFLRMLKNVFYLGELDKMTKPQIIARIEDAALGNNLG